MEINLQIQVEFNLDIIRKIQVVTFMCMWNLKGNPIIEERMYNFQISKIRTIKTNQHQILNEILIINWL